MAAGLLGEVPEKEVEPISLNGFFSSARGSLGLAGVPNARVVFARGGVGDRGAGSLEPRENRSFHTIGL